ncbi:quinone-dependent dihydroorotate dehydrogenase [Acidithiobacillus sp.]|uniref:quinone-dependent dihydroorotate dehydrogenase n=1 Tax=Acidithiobacillus sp. TaxID=1872118 RepID=UPI003D08C69A
MIYKMLRRGLFLLDPETAHHWTIAGLGALGHMPATRARLAARYTLEDPRLAQEIWGLRFANPLGLAAGFDKNAEALPALPALGFGFVEIGTVTPRPQPGNPRPRIFRFPEREAVINRMGFPGQGMAAVAARLAALGAHPVPIGINLGKNKDTPAGQAAADYVAVVEGLQPWADYFAVNVSSPNTPGLRDLQALDALQPLLAAVQAANLRVAREAGRRCPPVLLKIAPDLADADLMAIAGLANGEQPLVDGFIATNTTISREDFLEGAGISGGLSGPPLRGRATAVIRLLHQATAGKVPIIGVGGVFSAADAWEKISAGASLLELYTALIFRGPGVVDAILKGLLARMEEAGIANLAALRGKNS